MNPNLVTRNCCGMKKHDWGALVATAALTLVWVALNSEQRYCIILDAPVRSPADLCKVPVVTTTSRLCIIVTDHSVCLAPRCRPKARLKVSDRFDFVICKTLCNYLSNTAVTLVGDIILGDAISAKL